jgi:hypothetical protein
MFLYDLLKYGPTYGTYCTYYFTYHTPIENYEVTKMSVMTTHSFVPLGRCLQPRINLTISPGTPFINFWIFRGPKLVI